MNRLLRAIRAISDTYGVSGPPDHPVIMFTTGGVAYQLTIKQIPSSN